ncbi:MAG: alpha/beta hydrolase [Cyanobium sp. M30B3]|nr:MAG: alpha/beta hydrolase [Cyanobium sp. M30B3]
MGRRLLRISIGGCLLVGGVLVAGALVHGGLERFGRVGSNDLQELALLLAWLVGLLVPITGIYSVAGQYAFWNGWLGGLPDPASLFAQGDPPEGAASTATFTATASQPAPADRFVVYLDGIHQSVEEHPPRVAALLAELAAGLPAGTALIEGVQTYTISPAELAADAGSRWFWRRLFALQEHHPNRLVNAICAALVQANNVIKVGISADRRYGPILNYELALKVARRLVEAGLRQGSGQRIVLLGYSGGGEMAMGMADVLQVLCRCPVQILTCCGVFSGNQRLDQVAGIAMVVGSRDPVAALGPLLFPGRSSLLPLSNWNKARFAGRVKREVVAGMGHNGRGGPFSPRHRSTVVALILEHLAWMDQPPAA